MGPKGWERAVPISSRLGLLGPASLWPWCPHCTPRRKLPKLLSLRMKDAAPRPLLPVKQGGRCRHPFWLVSSLIIFEDERGWGLRRSQPGTGGSGAGPALPDQNRAQPRGTEHATFLCTAPQWAPHQPHRLPFPPLLWATSLSGQDQPQVGWSCSKGI